MILAVALGLVIGVSLGALGGGGSILAVPVLAHIAGQSASFVDAIIPLYVAPTLLPLRTILPGKGRITFGVPLIAVTAASAAARAASAVSARIRKLPPPIPFFCMPNVSDSRNSPSMTGIRQ